MSTRTDVLPKAYTDTLKTLTDEVPGFDGARAKEIVSRELGRPCDEVFENFSAKPLKAASLGQVHTATYKGKKVAIKVQRAGLKELFDTDLKNLQRLAVLLDKFDPKSDGADRDWVGIYKESEAQLYREIDYINEANNAKRFAKDFASYDWVRVPKVLDELTTPRVLTMEFVESFKLTDVKEVERQGLDRKLLAKRVADSFLRQVVETSFFHAEYVAVDRLIFSQITLTRNRRSLSVLTVVTFASTRKGSLSSMTLVRWMNYDRSYNGGFVHFARLSSKADP
jgi:predicted unusual protein kinase regulating ubiquinone biosynthesis (AarF/ABC1/UbiB family)